MRVALVGLCALMGACGSVRVPLVDGGGSASDAALGDAAPGDAGGVPDAGASETCTARPLASWDEARLPARLESVAVAATRTHAFVVGGFGVSGASARVLVAPIGPSGVGAFVDSGHPLPEGRDHLAAVVVPGGLCALGGYDAVGPRAETFCAPLASDGTLGDFIASTPLPVPRALLFVAFVSDLVVVAGGAPASGVADSEVLVAPVAAGALGAFRSSGRMLVGVAWATGAAVGDRIWITSGDAAGGNVQTGRIASDGTSTWTFAGPTPTGAIGRAAAAIGGQLWLLGGGDRGDVWAATIEPDGMLGAFVAELSLPAPRFGTGALAAGSFLCAVGGLVSRGNPSDVVWCARACE